MVEVGSAGIVGISPGGQVLGATGQKHGKPETVLETTSVCRHRLCRPSTVGTPPGPPPPPPPGRRRPAGRDVSEAINKGAPEETIGPPGFLPPTMGASVVRPLSVGDILIGPPGFFPSDMGTSVGRFRAVMVPGLLGTTRLPPMSEVVVVVVDGGELHWSQLLSGYSVVLAVRSL